MVARRGWLVVFAFACACKPSPDPSPQPELQLADSWPVATPQTASVRVTAEASLVAEVQVVPGKLVVNVYTHGMASTTSDWHRSMWTYVSEGLAPLGHQEIVMTVVKRPDEADTDYPRDLLQLYAGIYSFAANGDIATEYTITELGTSGPGLLASRDLHVVYYAPGQLVPGVVLPGEFLTALLITPEELEQAKAFGPVRLFSTLGLDAGYYPFPPWTDRERPRLRPSSGGLLIEEVGRGTVPGLTASFEFGSAPAGEGSSRTIEQEGGRILVRVGPEDRKEVARVVDMLAADTALVLFTELDRDADGVLAYVPGSEGAQALACSQGPVARVSANFVVLAPGDRDTGAIVEDGVAVLLRRETSWKHALEALQAEKPLEMPLDRGQTLVVEWTDTRNDAPMTSYCLR